MTESNITVSRLQALSKKLQQQQSSHSNQTHPYSLPSPLISAGDIQSRWKHHQSKFTNSIQKISSQVLTIQTSLHQALRSNNIHSIQSDDKIDNLKYNIDSSIKFQNINTKHKQDKLELELKYKYTRAVSESNENQNDVEAKAEVLKKRGMKLAANICMELKDYKEGSTVRVKMAEEKVMGVIGEIREMIEKESRERRQARVELERLVIEIERKLKQSVESMTKDRQIFYKKILSQMETSLERIIR